MIWADGEEYGTAPELAARLGSGVTDAIVRRWHYTRGLPKHRMLDDLGRPRVVFPLSVAARIEQETREATRGRRRAASHPGYVWTAEDEYVTTAEAASRFSGAVTTEMIHDWVKRGLLEPAGRQKGGSNLFRFLDVARAERDTREERRGRTRRTVKLRKIATGPHNLRTEGQAESAQGQDRPRCIVVDDNGRKCGNDPVSDAPFDICRDHMREVYVYWRDNLAAVYGVQERLPMIPEARAIPEAERERPSFIYYIRFGDRIKIGFTTDLRTRLAALPFDELLALEPGPSELERMRHRQFEAHRLSGEWFQQHPDLIAHTRMLAAHYGTPDAVAASVEVRIPRHKVSAV